MKTTLESIIKDYGCEDGEYLDGIGVIGFRCQEAAAEVGDILPNSYRWDDNEQTDDELDGACALGAITDAPTPDTLRAWYNALRGYPGTHIYLIGGEYGTYGEDRGEVIVRNARVLAEVA
jgi:hypothetical protein